MIFGNAAKFCYLQKRLQTLTAQSHFLWATSEQFPLFSKYTVIPTTAHTALKDTATAL